MSFSKFGSIADIQPEDESEQDILFIMGADNPGDFDFQNFVKKLKDDLQKQEFEKHIENYNNPNPSPPLKYKIIGDGQSLTLDDLAKLPKAKHIIINGHGGVTQNRHTLMLTNNYSHDSIELLRMIQNQTGAKNILYCACFAGKIVHDLKQIEQAVLQPGTSLFVPSSIEETSVKNDNLALITGYFNKVGQQQAAPLMKLVQDAVHSIPQTMVFAHQPQTKEGNSSHLRSHTIRRSDREVYLEVEKFCNYLNEGLNDFIDELVMTGEADALFTEWEKAFPHFKSYQENLATEHKTRLLEQQMTPEQIQLYHQRSLLNHMNHNDFKIMRQLLAKELFDSQLLYCAINWNLKLDEMVDLLLKHNQNAMHGQTVNAFTADGRYGVSPLTLALIRGKAAVAKILLEHGANPFLADSYGNIPIEMMQKNEDYNYLISEPLPDAKKAIFCGKIFLEKMNAAALNQDPNLKKEISFALAKAQELRQICKEEGDEDFFNEEAPLPKNERVYFAYKAFVDAAKQINPKRLLRIALDHQEKEVANVLVKAIQFPSLYHLAKNGRLDDIKLLLEHGIDINTTGLNSQTALHAAIINNHLDVVLELLRNHADLNARDKIGNTPLFTALTHQRFEAFALLIKNGADLTAKNNNQSNLLHMAILYAPPTLIDELIMRKVDMDAQDCQGKTPLHIALECGRFDVVGSLLEAGANIHLADQEGKTAFDSLPFITKNYYKLMLRNAYSATTLCLDLHKRIPIVWLSPSLRIRSSTAAM